MTSADVISAISTVGFPIVMVLILAFILYKAIVEFLKVIRDLMEEHHKEAENNNKALNEVSGAITHLSDLIDTIIRRNE